MKIMSSPSPAGNSTNADGGGGAVSLAEAPSSVTSPSSTEQVAESAVTLSDLTDLEKAMKEAGIFSALKASSSVIHLSL